MQAGGSISLTASNLNIDGTLKAASGSINITSVADSSELLQDRSSTAIPVAQQLRIGEHAVLDARGEWVNDAYLGPDQQTGQAYIDGGSISLSTLPTSARQLVSGTRGTNEAVYGDRIDTTASIILEHGSLLDVSSGGYVRADGTLAVRNGVPLGRGGDIAIAVYNSRVAPYLASTLPTVQPTAARLELGGDLRGYGFAGGGTLSLEALEIQIGGDASTAHPYTLVLAPEFFAGQGFGAYDLRASYNATIVDGTQLHVSQRNLLPDYQSLLLAPTGSDLYASDAAHLQGRYATVGTLDAYDRQPTDFSLRSGLFLSWPKDSTNIAPDYGQAGGGTGSLLLGRGAAIITDPGAAVTLGSQNQLTVLGSITAHGGSITLTGDASGASGGGYAPPVLGFGASNGAYYDSGKSIWLGAESLLDVSGISVLDPNATPVLNGNTARTPRTGRLYGGGDVVISSNTGYVIAESGARIDVSGAHDTYELPSQSPVAGAPLSGQAVWSDGGSITLATSQGLYLDASISAAGGAAQARGGTLTVTPLVGASPGTGLPVYSATSIVVVQGGEQLPAGLAPRDEIEAQPSGRLYLAADRLQGSGIENLQLGAYYDAPLSANAALVPVTFSGNVQLSLPGTLSLTAPSLSASANPDGSAAQIALSAAYVALHGQRGSPFVPELTQSGEASLAVQAKFIDISDTLTLSGFADSRFDSDGDIRFSAMPGIGSVPTTVLAGQLYSSGDLSFRAAQLYPATNSRYAIRALGINDPLSGLRDETTITILPGVNTAQAPLSANGSLLFDATHIVQNGTVRAPFGNILLGVSDPNDAATRALFGNATLTATASLQLGAGSLTSASGAGLLIPYGVTVDQVQYLPVNASTGTTVVNELTAPPGKTITLGGNTVTLSEGAVIDLSGGGDLYAMEWIPGTGGTRDVLADYNTSYANLTPTQVPLFPDQRQVYAIVPAYSGGAAPYDYNLDTGIAVGRSVYLSGVAGLPAGMYTLLPGKYATLPGAYRLVQDTGVSNALARSNAVLPDGSLRIAGWFADGLTGARDAQASSFIVQPASVWSQYSEYALTRAGDFFAKLADSRGTA
ncbi:MAG: filamentous hemagglutinin family protein, partial [Solimonas sp.]